MNKYLGFTRLKYGDLSVRKVARTESADFVNWTKAEVVMEGVDIRLQIHDMVVFPAPGWLGGLRAEREVRTRGCRDGPAEMGWQQAKLRLTADLAANGFVKVAVLRSSDSKKMESAPILEIVTDGEALGLERLMELAGFGDLARLRFDLRDAKIYSFRFADN